MKKFIIPEIELRDLSPVQTIMDDITVSGEVPGFSGSETVVDDKTTDDAVW